MFPSMSENQIVIVGAGVIGLSIAHQLLLTLQKYNGKNSGLKVVVLEKHFPLDFPLSHEYTSPWEGAHFRYFFHRPESYASEKREYAYTRATYKYFMQLVRKSPESTLKFMKGVDWLEDPTSEHANL